MSILGPEAQRNNTAPEATAKEEAVRSSSPQMVMALWDNAEDADFNCKRGGSFFRVRLC